MPKPARASAKPEPKPKRRPPSKSAAAPKRVAKAKSKATKRTSARPAKPTVTAAGAGRESRSISVNTAEEAHFVAGILTRGEAAPSSPSGQLPPGATHELVQGATPDSAKLRRKRFSLR